MCSIEVKIADGRIELLPVHRVSRDADLMLMLLQILRCGVSPVALGPYPKNLS